jgi:uncharacterized protein YeaO (DUF488 family)
MIYTSYFAKLKSLPKNVLPISICGKAPVWYTGMQYKKLAPKYDFFMDWKRTHDNKTYTKCFNEQVLNNLDVVEVSQELIDIMVQAECEHIALVCYEKSSDFCHRHLVSAWLTGNNIKCEEYKFTS